MDSSHKLQVQYLYDEWPHRVDALVADVRGELREVHVYHCTLGGVAVRRHLDQNNTFMGVSGLGILQKINYTIK